MPLIDHFRPPLSEPHWTWFHEKWADAIADALNEQLPETLFAKPCLQPTCGMSTYVRDEEATPPTVPQFRLPLQLMESLEVHICSQLFAPEVHSTIMFVSPTNKGVAAQRRAFVSKAFALLSQNVSVAVIDTVTTEPGCIHAELMNMLRGGDQSDESNPSGPYVAAYNSLWPMSESLEIMIEPFSVGGKLPKFPIRISESANPDCALIDLDETYSVACSKWFLK